MPTVRIDDLPSTVLPTLEHEIPSMKDNLTVKLSVNQIVNLAKNSILNGAPEALDTLEELASALGDDPNFSTTILNLISQNSNDISESVPAGTIMTFCSNSAPTGWLKANGATISRTTYSNLFSNIGILFGNGDGSTTFQLPDLRGEFVRFWDDGRNIDGGRLFGSFQSDEIKQHSHTFPYIDNWGSGGTFNVRYAYGASPGLYTTNSEGGNETRPRNVALLACIKY